MCTRNECECSLKSMVVESNKPPFFDCCSNDGSCCHIVPPYNKLISLENCCCGTNSQLPPARFFEYFYDRKQRTSTMPQFTMLQNPDFIAAPHKQSHWPQYQNMTPDRVRKPDAERFVRTFEFAPNYPSPIAAVMTRPNECMPCIKMSLSLVMTDDTLFMRTQQLSITYLIDVATFNDDYPKYAENVINRFNHKHFDFVGLIAAKREQENLSTIISEVPDIIQRLCDTIINQLKSWIVDTTNTKQYRLNENQLRSVVPHHLTNLFVENTATRVLGIDLRKRFSVNKCDEIRYYVANNVFATCTEEYKIKYDTVLERHLNILSTHHRTRLALIPQQFPVSIMGASYFSPDRQYIHLVFVRGMMFVYRNLRDHRHVRIHIRCCEIDIRVKTKKFFEKCAHIGLLDICIDDDTTDDTRDDDDDTNDGDDDTNDDIIPDRLLSGERVGHCD